MDELKDIVKKVFLDISSKTISEQKKLEEAFAKVLKDNKLSGARISGYKDKHLYIEVDSSARLYQFNIIKQKLLNDLKADWPDVEKVSFKIGKVD